MPLPISRFSYSHFATEGTRVVAAPGRVAMTGRQDPDPDWQPI